MTVDGFRERLRRERQVLVTEENLHAVRAFPRGEGIALCRPGDPIGPNDPLASHLGSSYRFLVELASTDVPQIGDQITARSSAII